MTGRVIFVCKKELSIFTKLSLLNLTFNDVDTSKLHWQSHCCLHVACNVNIKYRHASHYSVSWSNQSVKVLHILLFRLHTRKYIMIFPAVSNHLSDQRMCILWILETDRWSNAADVCFYTDCSGVFVHIFKFKYYLSVCIYIYVAEIHIYMEQTFWLNAIIPNTRMVSDLVLFTQIFNSDIAHSFCVFVILIHIY